MVDLSRVQFKHLDMYRFCAGEIRRTIWLYFLDLVALLAGGGASFFAASSSSSGLLFLAPRLLSSFKHAIKKYIFVAADQSLRKTWSVAGNSANEKGRVWGFVHLDVVGNFLRGSLGCRAPLPRHRRFLGNMASVKIRLYLRSIVIRLREKRQNHDQHNDEALRRSGVHVVNCPTRQSLLLFIGSLHWFPYPNNKEI